MNAGIFLITIFVLFTIISMATFALSEKKFSLWGLWVGPVLGTFLTVGYFAIGAIVIEGVHYGKPAEDEQRISTEILEINLGEERNYVLTFPNEVYRKVYKGTDFRCNLSDDPILYSDYTYGPDTISGGCKILG